jgi:acetyl-CoA C-acetyltransferase
VEPELYRRQIGELFAPMTHTAANNPNAWFPQVRSAAELVDVTAENRLVGYPYTKRTVAFMDVDMSAAVIIASHEAADRLGVPQDRRVYLRGSSYATDAVYLAEHPDLSRSEAMTTAFGSALQQADVSIEKIDHLDLYSCFASSVHFAADALGINLLIADRSLTVTGGLPYAGGPASNYLSHSIAAMVDVLRTDPGSFGLVSGVGMHMTKHIAAVYCTEPASAAVEPAEPQAAPAAPTALLLVDSYSGPATIATYSVVHGRDGSAQWGLLVVDLPQGAGRAYGRVEEAGFLARLEAEEMVGSEVRMTAQNDRNLATSA